MRISTHSFYSRLFVRFVDDPIELLCNNCTLPASRVAARFLPHFFFRESRDASIAESAPIF